MLCGVSTACYYPMYTEEALGKLAELSPQCVEIFINAASELEPAYLKELRKVADQHNIKVVSIHPYTSGLEPLYFFSGYSRRFDEGLDFYKRYYQAANILGADIVVFHGMTKHIPYRREEYFHRFYKLWESAREYGVELCQENVARCMSCSADFFKEMRKELPHIGFVLDIKQTIRAGEDTYQFADCMGSQLRHLHISDHNDLQDCMPLGTKNGLLNIEKLLSIITKNGFDGSLVVELYRENFSDFVELKRGYQHLFTAISTKL